MSSWRMIVFLPPPCRPGGAAPVEVAAELREVDRGRPGGGAVEAEVSGGGRLSGLLHARKRGEDLLFGSGGGGG